MVCAKLAALLVVFFSSLMGRVMVACCSGGSGAIIALSHRPLIFNLSATFRKLCSESCVMLTWGRRRGDISLFSIPGSYLPKVNEIHEGSEVSWSYIRQQEHWVLKRNRG